MRILGKEERWEPALECVSGRVETPRRARGQRRRRSLERPGARAGSGRLPPGLLFQAGGGRARSSPASPREAPTEVVAALQRNGTFEEP